MVFNPFKKVWEFVNVMNWKCTEVINVLKHSNTSKNLAAPQAEKKTEVAKSSSSNRSRSTAASKNLPAPAKRAPEKRTSPANLAPEKKEQPKRGKSNAPASKAQRPQPFSHHFDKKLIEEAKKAEAAIADLRNVFEKL